MNLYANLVYSYSYYRGEDGMDAQRQSTVFLVLALLCIVIGAAILWRYVDGSMWWRLLGNAVMIMGGSQFGALSYRRHREVLDERRGYRRRKR